MEFSPVTQERIDQALSSLGIAFHHDEYGNTAVNFDDMHCYFVINDNNFVARADWRGAATREEDFLPLRELINYLNTNMPSLRVSVQTDKGGVQPQGFALFPLPLGVNDEQLKLMLDFFFTGVQQVADFLSEHACELKFGAAKNNEEES